MQENPNIKKKLLNRRSLKRTTDEIRNYSFDLDLGHDRRDSLEKHRDSTSQVISS